jgi:ATP-dependent helicase/nuclease subunit B
MVYLDGALKAEKQKHPNKEIVPAGVFYYHVQDPMIQVKAKEDLDRLEEQIRKKMKMSGLVSSEKTVLHKLDSTLQSLPVSLNKGGSFSKYSKVADPGQFKQLGEYVEKKIKDLSERIDGGEVEIAPYELDKKQGCTYCPYKSVCGFDQKIPGFEFRRLKRFSDEEIWAAMNRKEE